MRVSRSQPVEGQIVPVDHTSSSAGHGIGTIKVLLAEDLDLLRSALVSLLSEEQDIEVVAALKCNDKVIQVAMRLRPDVIVVDVDLPCTNGLSTVRDLRRRLPETQIVALAAAKPAGLVQRLLAADVLGAVDKNAPAARLLEAIRGAAKGELVVDVNLAVAALAVEPNPLTPRELEVLRLAADGASGPEIAERLHLSPGTVRNYLSKVINKTCARTRVDAVRIARESGWI
ncbi:MAG TPA: response regulator transcription factor [Actinophytocola sp.]|uniref:response regulator transcription factor n=1 Tax=Actinophytocola sp. TaxID=1872138 RepID=UPI002DBF9795|nr:response regulator transcription factor [Actinophytocola sp.]HEU5475958.1 response regulator transcription factor [Actinophytocola sp.]